MTLDDALEGCPVIAVLRGVIADEAVVHAEALFEAGVLAVEIPLNSPDPFESLRRIVGALGERMVVGAGTVLCIEDIDAVAAVGGQIAVSPNANASVIRRSLERGLTPIPGFATASEAFAAIAAGARWLKLFPASTYGPGHLRALKAVLPAEVRILAVGGVGPIDMGPWRTAGAAGFGLGSELYRPGQSPTETLAKGRRAVAAAS